MNVRPTTVSFVFAVILGALIPLSAASANVNTKWDWGQNKTSINICVDDNLDSDIADAREENEEIDWDQVVNDAMEIWNNALTATTDWTFTRETEGEACQVNIRAVAPAERCQDKGPLMDKFVGLTSKHVVNGRAEKLSVCISTRRNRGPGWGSTGRYYDPILVMAHELGHTIRLADVLKDASAHKDDIMWGHGKAGRHDRTLKPTDIAMARSSVTNRLFDNDGDGHIDVDHVIGPAGGSVLVPPAVAGRCSVEVVIGAAALSADHTFTTTPVDAVSIPAVGRVPDGMAVVVGFGLGIVPPIAGSVEAEFTVDYACEVASDPALGVLLDSAPISTSPNVAGVPDSVLSAWVLQPLGDWDESVATMSAVDTTNQTATFTAPLLSTIYGVGGPVAFPVGGVAELPDAAASPVETNSPAAPNVALVAAIAAAGVIALGGAVWYARTRLLR